MKMFSGNILEAHYMIDIPTDSDDLAQLIYSNSYDWSVCLDFIDSVTKSHGIVIKKREVAEKIKELLGIGL